MATSLLVYRGLEKPAPPNGQTNTQLNSHPPARACHVTILHSGSTAPRRSTASARWRREICLGLGRPPSAPLDRRERRDPVARAGLKHHLGRRVPDGELHRPPARAPCWPCVVEPHHAERAYGPWWAQRVQRRGVHQRLGVRKQRGALLRRPEQCAAVRLHVGRLQPPRELFRRLLVVLERPDLGL